MAHWAVAQCKADRDGQLPIGCGPAAATVDALEETATLGRLTALLGRSVAEVLTAPSGLDVVVRDLVLYDAVDTTEVHAGDLVLAVGIDADGAGGVGTLERAAAAGCAGVMMKLSGPPSPALFAACGGTSLIAIPFGMSWLSLLDLIRTALPPEVRRPMSGDADAFGDLFALANAIAAMVGGPTIIGDLQHKVLAYDTLDYPVDERRREAILGRRMPADLVEVYRESGVFERLRTTGEVVRYDLPEAGLPNRMAIGVRAGDEPLGVIWVAQGTEPLGDAAEQALRGAAELAALHLIRHRASGDLERRRRGEVLRALLEGRIAPARGATSLGFDASAKVAVLGFEVLGPDEASASKLDRAVDLLVLSFESYRRRAVCVVIGPVVYVLLGEGPEPDSALMRSVIDDVTNRVGHSLRADLLVGIGRTAPPRDVTVSRSQADEILRVLRRRGVPATADLRDVKSEVAMNRLRDHFGEDALLAGGVLDALSAEDERKGTEYVATLAAYLTALGEVRSAAARLGVHPNTLRNRLAKIEELTDVALDDADERFLLDLQLRLRGAGQAWSGSGQTAGP